MLKPSFYLFWAALLVLAGCQIQGMDPTNPDKKDVTQRDLYRAARSQQRILLVDGWNNNDFRRKVRNLVKEFHSENWEVIVKGHDEVSAEELTSIPLMLIGTPDQNPWIGKIMSGLPFEVKRNKIYFADHSFEASSHAATRSSALRATKQGALSTLSRGRAGAGSFSVVHGFWYPCRGR